MTIRTIHRFKTPAYSRYSVYLTQGQQDVLGVLYISTTPDAPADYKVSLALIDVQKRMCEHIISYGNKGPDDNVLMDALLRYDVDHRRWIIAQLQGEDYLALRTIIVGEEGNVKLSPLCLLDKDESNRGFNPLLGLEILNGAYRFLYHKAAFEHKTAPMITKLDVVLQHPAWDVVEEQRDNRHTADTAILLPEQVSFDPGTANAVQTKALVITSKMDIAEAENALIFTDQPVKLLILFSPETWVTPQMDRPDSHTEEQWRIWFTGWDSNWNALKWTYSPDLGLPTDPNVPSWESPIWPTAHVAVIAGPALDSQSSATYVAALAMLNEDEVLSHGVCLDERGQVVQLCSSPLGLRPCLACCEQRIVGVDLFEGRWRLWLWDVLQQNGLRNQISLDVTCQRAAIHAEPASDRFWLIEELSDGVRITHRDSATLAEIAPAAYLDGVRLLADQEENRPLDGYQSRGILPYQETLLVLAKSADGELVLYQVQ